MISLIFKALYIKPRACYIDPISYLKAYSLIYGVKFQIILSSTIHTNKGMWYSFLEAWLGTGLLTASGE